MRTRCKDGDLTIVIKDEPGCEANLGRFLRVHGPKELRPVLGPFWHTTAITAAPMLFRNPSGHVEYINRLKAIRRSDAWLLPIRVRKSRSKSVKASGTSSNAGRSRK
jgi:hypothetical protein